VVKRLAVKQSRFLSRMPTDGKQNHLLLKIITLFQQTLQETQISPVIAHNSYLINLASPDEDLWMKSLEALIVEVERCAALEIPFLVIHPGAHKGAGEKVGLNRITIALNEVLKRTESSKVNHPFGEHRGTGLNPGRAV